MKNLIRIEDLSKEEILQIYNRAYEFEKNTRKANHIDAQVVTMFFENSTRTKLSFELALNRIKANKYDFQVSTSSINKGEELFDTINNLSAIGFDTIILRHKEDSLIEELVNKKYYNDISFINAGSGMSAHPTQALLDFYTMKKQFGSIEGKTITIVGDVVHSRVFKSNIELLKKFNVNIQILAPEIFIDESIEGIQYFSNLKAAFEKTDIIMALRIQKERISEKIDFEDYIKNYQITKENLPYGAFLMHPGPVNRGIEIESSVLELQSARTILNQAKNGVFVRMAILDMILSNRGL